MSFKNDKAIYLQMAERLCDDILAGKYKSDERIPSVREYAVMLEVNTNTAVKAYDELSREGIIYNRRGLGYFVASDAAERIHGHRREAFFKEMLPDVFRQMTLLGIDIEEIEERWIKSKEVKK
ncbi:GntR family transcriptional regulator [Prevotella sp. AGR2160]|uniref:GntR family transcriptional regulator n=1 Tax=Prevotella sp. AGR2160 TaxID=1280674 RepID=UPI00041297F1|nr:GntR family transcriptional regulator [Prevotella sp. AGR2160]